MKACLARRPLLVLLVAAAVAAGGSSRAADPRPSWECLPEGTVAMVRVPRPAAFLETLRSRTKFGAVVLGADRLRGAWDALVEMAREDDNVDLTDIGKDLAKYGLEAGDLEAAFAGDMGAGIVLMKRDGLPPLPMVLAWMEPGPDAAQRMVAALHKLVEEEAGTEGAPERVDMEMAGHDVTWITQPILRADLGEMKLEGGLDAEKLKELRAELEERAKQAPKVVAGKMHVFLARIAGRLVAGQTLPPPPTNMRIGVEQREGGLALNVGAEVPADAAEDPDRTSGTDEARGVFERFLAAHAAGDPAPLADLLGTPGMRAALPAGEPLADAVLDPRPLLEAAAGDDAEAARRMAAVGLGDMGPLAMRVSFDAGRLRQGLFLTLPAPRSGLLRILDQEGDAAEVPSFVTSEAVDFTQISLDLAQAYRTVKEFAVAEGGDQVANMFMTAEMQAQGWLGTELEAMLANIGSRHWIITYPPRIAEAVQEARRNRAAGGGPDATSADRLALVWKLSDDEPMLALLPKVAALVQEQVVEEQGFQGVRLPNGPAVFVGQGHLVVGMGGDAVEKTLAGIRNPPAGAASLREGDVPRTGADLVGFGPCRMFAVGDATRTGGMLGELRDSVAAMLPEDVDDDERDFLARLQGLMPTAAEMEGMFGVGAAIMEVNDAGVAIRSAWEMPAP